MLPVRRARSQVSRTSLLQNLTNNADCHLTVIHAPAGYGKSTLLAQYYDQLIESGENCGWLSLKYTDADPVQLLAYLIASLNSTSLIPEDILNSAFNGLHGMREMESITLLANILSGTTAPVFFLLDDYHELQEGKSNETIQRLIALTRNNVRFILTSRHFPVQLKGRVQLSGSYYELTTTELAFSRLETCNYYREVHEIELSESAVNIIHQNTEGWVGAMEFAKEWVNVALTPDENFRLTQSTDMTTFMMSEILSRLPAAYREMALKSSIVNEFNESLLNSLCARKDSWQFLDELLQRDLILKQDEPGRWYRYHNLLAEFLRARLEMEYSTKITQLHRSAAMWYIESGNSTEALHHAQESGDTQLMASVLEQAGGWHFVIDGRISTLNVVLAQLSIDTIRDHPSLYLGYILVLAKSGEIAKAVDKFTEFRDRTKHFSIFGKQLLSETFKIEANVVEFFLGGLSDRPQTAQYISRMESIKKLVAKDNHLLTANILNFLSYGYFDYGQFEKAYKAGENAISHYKEIGSIYGENFLYFHLGKICLAQGRLRDALQFYHEGFELAQKHFGIDSDLVAIAAALLAEVSYEKNEIDDAKKFLDIAFPQIENSEAWFDVYISAYITASRIAQLEGKPKSSEQTLSRASRVGRKRKILRLRIFALCEKVQLLARLGKVKRARVLMQRLRLESVLLKNRDSEFISARIIEVVGYTVAYCSIGLGNPQTSLSELEPLIAYAKRINSRRSLMSLLLLSACALNELEKHKQALARLNEAVSLALFEGFKRPFLDPILKGVICMALSGKYHFPINRLKKSFLVGIQNETQNLVQEQKLGPGHTLTNREREVLQLVCDGCSNKEIARNFDFSVNTVKFHMKNIFKKLGVNNRKAAARIAWRHFFLT